MNKIAVYLVALALFGAAALMTSNLYRAHKDQLRLIQIALEASQQENALLEAQLQNMHKVYQESDAAQAELRTHIEDVDAALNQHKKVLEKLKNENKEIKAWSDTRLPADIARLRQRPEIASGAAYRDWLSHRDSLPPASDPSPNQWRAESSNR
jgi:LysB family phage lysis regulatory protein